MSFHQVSECPSLPPVQVTSADPALADLIMLQGITPKHPEGDVAEQAASAFEALDAVLAEHGMTKHHVVDLKSTIGHLPDIILFNQAFDAWMTGVDVLPAQTACQMVPFAGGVRLALSVTATKAPKTVREPPLTRPGGGEPDVMIPQPLHFPWSKAVEAGDLVWLAGLLNLEVGDDAAAQTRSVLADIDATLAELGLTVADVVQKELLIPMSLTESEQQAIEAISAEHGCADGTGIVRAEQTFGGCKVEITCIARRSVALGA